MQFVKATLPFLLFACAGATQAADPIDVRKLSDTSVTVVETTRAGSPGKSFVAGTIINAPVETLCAMIQDYASYPSFMPNTESTVVAMKSRSQAVIDVTLKLPMGKIKKYRLRMDPEVTPESCKVSWKQLPWRGLSAEETIADTYGYWQFTPAPAAAGKTATVVQYVVYTDPGPIPFGLGWIVDSLSKDSIPQTLEALRKKAVKK
jgi:ribosome-associated toxin RatA of RatAB toxin-antitoxin module